MQVVSCKLGIDFVSVCICETMTDPNLKKFIAISYDNGEMSVPINVAKEKKRNVLRFLQKGRVETKHGRKWYSGTISHCAGKIVLFMFFKPIA